MPAERSVLIVDDDPDIHVLLKAPLGGRGLEVESVFDSTGALQSVGERSYDVVLLDVLLPGMDGLTLLHRLRDVRPGLKVIIMTAANTPSNLVASIRQQAFSYFSKPFHQEVVVETVLRAIDSTDSHDDIEVISARPDWITLEVRCRVETVDRLVQFFREMNMGLNTQQQEHVVTAFRELLLNAIEHGCQLDPEKKVHLAYIRTPRAILYYIRDPGEGFSLDNLPHAAVSNQPESPIGHTEVRNQMGMRPGGFGILLTRNIADDLLYNEKGNEVLLVKYLDNGKKPEAPSA
jgi:DNA-binding response OmpR family regulator